MDIWNKKDDYINARDDFKSLKKALDTILELGSIESIDEIFSQYNIPKDSLRNLIISALNVDIQYMPEKNEDFPLKNKATICCIRI